MNGHSSHLPKLNYVCKIECLLEIRFIIHFQILQLQLALVLDLNSKIRA